MFEAKLMAKIKRLIFEINDLEKKLGKIVLSSNQTLIWDTLNQIDYKNKIEGYGELFNN